MRPALAGLAPRYRDLRQLCHLVSHSKISLLFENCLERRLVQGASLLCRIVFVLHGIGRSLALGLGSRKLAVAAPAKSSLQNASTASQHTKQQLVGTSP